MLKNIGLRPHFLLFLGLFCSHLEVAFSTDLTTALASKGFSATNMSARKIGISENYLYFIKGDSIYRIDLSNYGNFKRIINLPDNNYAGQLASFAQMAIAQDNALFMKTGYGELYSLKVDAQGSLLPKVRHFEEGKADASVVQEVFNPKSILVSAGSSQYFALSLENSSVALYNAAENSRIGYFPPIYLSSLACLSNETSRHPILWFVGPDSRKIFYSRVNDQFSNEANVQPQLISTTIQLFSVQGSVANGFYLAVVDEKNDLYLYNSQDTLGAWIKLDLGLPPLTMVRQVAINAQGKVAITVETNPLPDDSDKIFHSTYAKIKDIANTPPPATVTSPPVNNPPPASTTSSVKSDPVVVSPAPPAPPAPKVQAFPATGWQEFGFVGLFEQSEQAVGAVDFGINNNKLIFVKPILNPLLPVFQASIAPALSIGDVTPLYTAEGSGGEGLAVTNLDVSTNGNVLMRSAWQDLYLKNDATLTAIGHKIFSDDLILGENGAYFLSMPGDNDRQKSRISVFKHPFNSMLVNFEIQLPEIKTIQFQLDYPREMIQELKLENTVKNRLLFAVSSDAIPKVWYVKNNEEIYQADLANINSININPFVLQPPVGRSGIKGFSAKGSSANGYMAVLDGDNRVHLHKFGQPNWITVESETPKQINQVVVSKEGIVGIRFGEEGALKNCIMLSSYAKVSAQVMAKEAGLHSFFTVIEDLKVKKIALNEGRIFYSQFSDDKIFYINLLAAPLTRGNSLTTNAYNADSSRPVILKAGAAPDGTAYLQGQNETIYQAPGGDNLVRVIGVVSTIPNVEASTLVAGGKDKLFFGGGSANDKPGTIGVYTVAINAISKAFSVDLPNFNGLFCVSKDAEPTVWFITNHNEIRKIPGFKDGVKSDSSIKLDNQPSLKGAKITHFAARGTDASPNMIIVDDRQKIHFSFAGGAWFSIPFKGKIGQVCINDNTNIALTLKHEAQTAEEYDILISSVQKIKEVFGKVYPEKRSSGLSEGQIVGITAGAVGAAALAATATVGVIAYKRAKKQAVESRKKAVERLNELGQNATALDLFLINLSEAPETDINRDVLNKINKKLRKEDYEDYFKAFDVLLKQASKSNPKNGQKERARAQLNSLKEAFIANHDNFDEKDVVPLAALLHAWGYEGSSDEEKLTDSERLYSKDKQVLREKIKDFLVNPEDATKAALNPQLAIGIDLPFPRNPLRYEYKLPQAFHKDGLGCMLDLVSAIPVVVTPNPVTTRRRTGRSTPHRSSSPRSSAPASSSRRPQGVSSSQMLAPVPAATRSLPPAPGGSRGRQPAPAPLGSETVLGGSDSDDMPA